MKKYGSGVIILTASGAGVTGGSSSLAYGSSKGGVHGLSLVMESHLEKYNIRVNDVMPGSVDTPLKVANVQDMHEAGAKREPRRKNQRSCITRRRIQGLCIFSQRRCQYD
ncbi:MAG: hypothetical protein CM1200mP39_06880 [Dehalococcoidia bacterium]|nr:MAG: hypothetical protein CM1200mP39_06880 [Dehalococcoidia bacterium]